MPRPTYQPSRRANGAAYLRAAVPLFLAAEAAAALSAALLGWGWLLGPWFWLVPCGLLIWFADRAVVSGRCRSPAAATLVTLAAGSVATLGAFHLDQCERWGVGWHRLDRLPGYIAFRMETDEWADARGCFVAPQPAAPGVRPHRGPVWPANGHWAALALELAAVALVPAGFAWLVSRGAFSEVHGDWLLESWLVLTPPSAAALRAALDAGGVPGWLARDFEQGLSRQFGVRLAVCYCDGPPLDPRADREVYVVLGAGPAERLRPDEVAALAPVFPGLLGPDQRDGDAAAPAAPLFHAEPATLSVIPPPHVGRCDDPEVVDRAERVTCKFFGLPLLLVSLYAFTSIAFQVDADRWQAHRSPLSIGEPILITIALFFGGLIWAERWKTAYLLRHWRRELAVQARQRADALFDPDGPGVMLMQTVPPDSWVPPAGGPTPEGGDGVTRFPQDLGLALLDDGRGRLLFEGGYHRWAVPYAAVREVRVLLADEHFAGDALLVRFAAADGVGELAVTMVDGLPGRRPHDRLHLFMGRLRDRVPRRGVAPPVAAAG